MLSGAKHLVFSLTRKNKILRLKPQNDIAAQPRKRAEIWWVLVLAFSLLSFAVPARAAADLDEQARQIAGELRCPVCQNLSVADSPSELAQQMRAVIVQQLKEGKTPEQIKAFFVSKYGEWVLLAPEPKGLSLLLWILPYAVVGAGIVLVLLVTRHWVRRRQTSAPKKADPALVARVRQEVEHEQLEAGRATGDSPADLLVQERARIYGYMRELEFDYQAGKVSAADYQDLRSEYEVQAAAVLQNMDALPKAQAREATPRKREKRTERTLQGRPAGAGRRGWVLAVGGGFILVFGVAIGALLSMSLRDRQAQSDSITGDFLTGTGPAGMSPATGASAATADFSTLVAQGKSALERNDLPQAIEAFKGALVLDPNHPAPHAYMGLILAQAGHYDGALMAFDKALASDPKFPLALWGKGMLLFQVKKDLAGARQNLEKVLVLLPQGPERDEVQKALVQINLSGAASKQTVAQNEPAGAGAGNISGSVAIASDLKAKLTGNEALFIIARAAQSAGGPPLAVKKIDRPSFPVAYTLGQENVMMPGVAFSGKINVSARLDKDGNPTTRQAGDMVGEYKKNPVAVGTQKVAILIDKAL